MELNIGKSQLDEILFERDHFIGNDDRQITNVCNRIKGFYSKYKSEAEYKLAQIL